MFPIILFTEVNLAIYAFLEPALHSSVQLLTLLGYGVAAALANLVGGWWIVRHHGLSEKVLKYLIAAGAGFMLAAVFLKVVPASIAEQNGQATVPMLLLLAGYLLVQLVEHTIAQHFHFGEEVHEAAMVHPHAALTAVGGLAIHTFFDGVSIAAGFEVSFQLGLLIFIAIMLHKIPEGFTVASIMIASGRERKAARLATWVVGAATLLGVLTIALLHPLTAYALPFSAGVTLYVAASDLIPEVNNKGEGPITSLVVFGGVALYYLTDTLLDTLH
ncbi:MAG TPA: ZIP family metal transporter [Blastocatellia bacterium]|nr:ZIP family metal transporter [Blastocatellia bacterium]